MKIKQFSLLFVLLILFAAPLQVQAQQPVVHAVMFWMEGCPHCEDVIENVLPPLREKLGGQFDLLLIEVKSTADVDLLLRVAESYGFSKEQAGVPFLIIGEQALVGSDQVRNQLPALVEDYLTRGGLDFPKNPLLADLLPISTSSSTSELTAKPQAVIPDTNKYPVLRYVRCPAGTTKLTIMPDGTVYPCYLFARHADFILGNILHDNFERIWKNPILDVFRKFDRTSCINTKCELFSSCHGGCPAVSLLISGNIKAPDPRCVVCT